MEFPNGCFTSTYILNGFEDFAYVVCTVATPPGTQHAILKESNVSRLKNAERELRAASLLVSTDVDKLELFMFYRKSDLLRDQKILISKISPVLRTSYLIRSYNSGGKAVHLLKPEQARIYALFTRAILSSVWPLCIDGGNAIALGSRAYVRCENGTPQNPNPSFSEQPVQRTFCDIDIQILETGTVLMTNTAHGDVPLTSIADLLKSKPQPESLSLGRLLLRLAPTGQIARYNGTQPANTGQSGPMRITEDAEHTTKQENPAATTRQDVWRKKLSAWLIDQSQIQVAPDHFSWIDIEVPVVAETVPESPNDSFRTAWRKLDWPAELCFCINRRYAEVVSDRALDWSPEDPWEFIENWNASAGDRRDETSRKEREKAREQNSNDHQFDFEMSEDELQFGYTPHFQAHGLSDFPPSQLMYPTPPDGALAQATPGMSSFDGVDMTPAQMIRPAPDQRLSTMDDDMADVDDVQASGVGSGFYDEDLFEDIPGQKFGPAGAADEPNWDFFDEPDFEMADVEASSEIPKKYAAKSAAEANGIAQNGDISVLDSQVKLLSPQKNSNRSFDREAAQPDDQSVALANTPGQIHVESAQSKDTNSLQSVERSLGHGLSTALTDPKDAPRDYHETGHSAQPKRRRSSLYELEQNHSQVDSRDLSYAANGKYWFKNTDTNGRNDRPFRQFLQPEMYKRGMELRDEGSSTSMSDSDGSSSNGEDQMARNNRSAGGGYRGWTDYTPTIQDSPKPSTNQLEMESLEREATELIELLQFENYELPLLQDKLPDSTSLQPPIDASVDDLSKMAQMLVDVLSQTSFQRVQKDIFAIQEPNGEIPALLADLSKIDPAWDQADLESLTVAGAPPDSAETSPKIERLENCRIRIGRADQPLIAFPAIKPLWDSLGLQPNGGEKDITAYCIHPGGKNVADGCGTLLDRMHETYLSCNFGVHTTGQLTGATSKGLIGWSTQDDALPNLAQACEHLGTDLARHPPTTSVVMIYMINSSTNLPSYLQLCHAFYALFSAYHNACGGKTKMVDVALQIVPITFVVSAETVVVPTQNEYLNLAIEVYNRCPPNNIGYGLAVCGSAIVLAEPLQRKIEFDLTARHISPLSKAGECLHVAYCYSADKRWITAAWTDELGYLALTMSYCLRSKGSRSSLRSSEVIQEIWEVSHDLMAKHRSKWRLVVAKNGSYEAEEINDWLFHANSAAKDKTSNCTLVLTSINLNPSLTLSPPPSQQRAPVQGLSPSQPTRDYGTPVSTPQAANTTSPDQLMAATPIPTPGGPPVSSSSPPREDHNFDPATDTDLTANDPTEESWCVVLSHGLNQSRNILDVRPAMASGYLLKRRGAKDEDGVVGLGVNLIHTPIPAHEQAARQDLLKEVIIQHRGLVTLAVMRGSLVDSVKECVPWHISTAVKGARVLGMVF